MSLNFEPTPPGLSVIEGTHLAIMEELLKLGKCPICQSELEPSCWAYPSVCCHTWTCLHDWEQLRAPLQIALNAYGQAQGFERMLARLLCGECPVCARRRREGSAGWCCAREECARQWAVLERTRKAAALRVAYHARGG